MKKRSRTIIAFILVLATILTFVLSACSDLRLKLAKPELTYDNGVVSWTSIGFADGYELSFYEDANGERGEQTGETLSLKITNYALTVDGVYWVGVRAVAEKFNASDEAYLRVEKKNTEDDVTIPGGDDSDEGGAGGDTSDPSGGDTSHDVLPSGAPALHLPVGAQQKFNYISESAYGGVSVALTKETDAVARIFVAAGELTYGWSYDAENNAVELEYALFDGLKEGTDTKFTAMTESGKTFDFYVTLTGVADMPSTVDLPGYGAYVYCKSSETASEGLTVTYSSPASTQAVSMDGSKLTYRTTIYSVTSGAVNFKEDYLKSLDYGLHEVELFTSKGVIDFYIFVYSSSIMCYDLHYELDDTYPDIALKWSVDYPIDKFEVYVNGTVYSSVDNPDLFDGNSFDLTGIISAGSTCSAYVKSYVNAVDTPATSATAVYADYSSAIADYLDPSKGFTYFDKTYNRYIDSEEEMDVLAYYMIIYNYKLDEKSFNTSSGSKLMTYMDIYPAPSLGVTQASDIMQMFAESCGKYKESIKYLYAAVALPDGAYRIGLSMTSQNEALYDSETSYTESLSNEFHLTRSLRPSSFEDFAINDREGVVVETSDQLFFAIEAGLKPLPVAGSVAEGLYELAKDVCRTYIDDDMTDYEKVHAIYDWLGKNVVYDYNIVKEMGNIKPSSSLYDKFYSYDCFYLEGVLENGVAVCNGIAKTFVVLCGIEGITAVKVNGSASGGAHAWNKVLINEKWYIVDSTWSNRKTTENGKNVEKFTHEYLFLTTSESSADRTELTEDTLGYYCGDKQISVVY